MFKFHYGTFNFRGKFKNTKICNLHSQGCFTAVYRMNKLVKRSKPLHAVLANMKMGLEPKPAQLATNECDDGHCPQIAGTLKSET